jgi:hypothetical protein
MEKNLPVPYQSQHGADSKGSNADCGQASLAQVLTFLGKPITTGEVSEKLGNPTGFTTIQQLAKVATDFGFNAESKVDATFNELKSYIDKGLPVIVVGGYGYLTSTQDKEFKASHIMVVVGYRPDDSVYVNDPNFWGQFIKDGDHHVYTGPEFFTFWRNEGNKEGNQANILFVVSSVESAKQVKVTADKGLNGRTATNTQTLVAAVYPKGTVLDVISVHEGEAVSGNNKWLMVKKDIYVWSGGTEEVKVEKPAEKPVEKPKEPVVDKDKIIKDLQKKNKQLLETLKKLNEITNAFVEIETTPKREEAVNKWSNLLNFLHLG